MSRRTIRGRVAAGALVSVVALVLVAPASANGVPATPKNIIVFIGDGMGPEQVEIGRRVKGSPLFLDSIVSRGGYLSALDTDSLDGVTDSAAGATALATGCETSNGWVSMVPEPLGPCETVLEEWEDNQKSSGLFSTGDLPDATPAAFAAHVSDRGEDEEVAEQMHEQGIEFLLGGRGGGAVGPLEGDPDVTYAKNLRALQTAAAAYDDGDDPIYSLMGAQTLAYAIDREEEGAVGKHPTIAQGTQAALEILEEDPDGFFLMVEGGQIDWAGHSRDGGWTAAEVIAFDDAVKAAYEWADEADVLDETLFIVTADHETGGLEVDDSLNLTAIRKQKASTEWMWGAIRKNPTATTVNSVMSTYAGITNLTAAERNLILRNKEMGIADVLAARFNVGWELSGTDEGDHTGANVPIYAIGPDAVSYSTSVLGSPYANEEVGLRLLSYFP